jgi:hypothetical protein
MNLKTKIFFALALTTVLVITSGSIGIAIGKKQGQISQEEKIKVPVSLDDSQIETFLRDYYAYPTEKHGTFDFVEKMVAKNYQAKIKEELTQQKENPRTFGGNLSIQTINSYQKKLHAKEIQVLSLVEYSLMEEQKGQVAWYFTFQEQGEGYVITQMQQTEV